MTSSDKRGPFNYDNDPERPSPHLIFFKRNHGPIPDLSATTHKVFVSAPALKGAPQRAFSMADIHAMPRLEITAALQCAGNRRDGLNKLAKVKGVIWAAGTISNATWAGATMRDILLAAGIPDASDSAVQGWHVSFEAIGDCEEDVVYGSSIPLWIAMIRVIVPGIIGARSVKWISKITVQPQESESFYQQRDYKILPPHAQEKDLTEWWPRLAALQEMNVQSVICEPEENELMRGGPITIRGYAISGGGRAIERVDVSLDGGKTWGLAELYHPTKQQDRHWGWTLWSFRVPRLTVDAEIVCRAWDSAGNTQPNLPIYNYRGVMNNAYHRVQVKPKANC
ncbi:Mo-co oxidoreductase dimerization domain-containing protein [Syncephalis fuscata]|nr:Mo-co oxidoreductase dimerization domain-containing protein [Syncephalis fuscata]